MIVRLETHIQTVYFEIAQAASAKIQYPQATKLAANQTATVLFFPSITDFCTTLQLDTVKRIKSSDISKLQCGGKHLAMKDTQRTKKNN